MRVNTQTSFGFERGQYYDGIKNSLENHAENNGKESLKSNESKNDSTRLDSKVSMLAAEMTGIGTKLNFYI